MLIYKQKQYLSRFIKAIKVSLNKLEKYFPQRLTRANIKLYKSFILAIVLEP